MGGVGWRLHVQHAKTVVFTVFAAPPDRCCLLPSVTTVPGMGPFTWVFVHQEAKTTVFTVFLHVFTRPVFATVCFGPLSFLDAPCQQALEGILLFKMDVGRPALDSLVCFLVRLA